VQFRAAKFKKTAESLEAAFVPGPRSQPEQGMSNDHILLREFAEPKTGCMLAKLATASATRLSQSHWHKPGNFDCRHGFSYCHRRGLGAFACGMGSFGLAIVMGLGRTLVPRPGNFLLN